jgi:hypothetical protein
LNEPENYVVVWRMVESWGNIDWIASRKLLSGPARSGHKYVAATESLPEIWLEVEIEIVVDLSGRFGGGVECRFDWEKRQVMRVLILTSAFLVLYPSVGGVYMRKKIEERRHWNARQTTESLLSAFSHLWSVESLVDSRSASIPSWPWQLRSARTIAFPPAAVA